MQELDVRTQRSDYVRQADQIKNKLSKCIRAVAISAGLQMKSP